MKELKHYGTPRESGRYPWGSGENPYQSASSFLAMVSELRAKGLTEAQIAAGLGIKTTKLRARTSIARSEERARQVAEVLKLKEKGYSNVAVGKAMGINESSVRALLDPVIQERSQRLQKTADMLKENIEKHKYIDIGVGTERHIGITKNQLDIAVSMLEDQGYKVNFLNIEQLGNPGNFTSVRVIAKEEVPYTDIYNNLEKVKVIDHYTEDGGKSYLGLEPIRNISSDRVKIQYKEDGGADRDGVIELRRGVPELSLGNSRYSQVRIGVDGTHFLKGMAIYRDDMPKGIDILYNVNKSKGTPAEEVFKKYKADSDNPFGSTVRQRHYIDNEGNRQLSALNIMGSRDGSGEEGSWSEWSRSLSSQMLSKQPNALAKQQLDKAYDIKKAEYDEILQLTNPSIKRRLLTSFADDCDSSAVHLKAAALPRQGTHVLLPIPSLKDNEVYAPNYNNGEQVVLIRHPHGGKFEIPQLTVNNRHKDGRSILGNARDAIGINPTVANQLSGADFDGDTVLVIPNSPKVGVKVSKPLEALKDFDPSERYPYWEGMTVMKPSYVQRSMGDVSNLITDMTIKGATDAEIARAVKHSMVVIDAEKHKLDYRQSHIDNGIAQLKEKYQGGKNRGASTLISKASSEKRVNERKEGAVDPKTGRRLMIDPKTGEKLYTETGATYVDKKGKTVYLKSVTTNMADAKDAHSLSSGTQMETIYGDYANKNKALGNQARKETLAIKNTPYSPSAKRAYAHEVDTLDAKLNLALKNAPLERQAQLIATAVVRTKVKSNPDMDRDDTRKIKNQALNEARIRTGARKQAINNITPREWEAIQAGAISASKLDSILNNADLDHIKELATPRPNKTMSSVNESRIRAMLAAGRTQAEVANALGVSVSTVARVAN